MALDPSRYATLKADIIAKSAAGQPLQTLVANNDWQGVAAYYNAASATKVWRYDAKRSEVYGAIDWRNLTYNDTPDNTATQTNRYLACQSRQMQVDMLLGKGEDLPGHQQKYRKGWTDALTDVPSGANGALQDAGVAGVRAALQRFGTRLEVLFSTTDQQAQLVNVDVYGVTVDGNDCYLAFTS